MTLTTSHIEDIYSCSQPIPKPIYEWDYLVYQPSVKDTSCIFGLQLLKPWKCRIWNPATFTKAFNDLLFDIA
jgi:hypothetical protein